MWGLFLGLLFGVFALIVIFIWRPNANVRSGIIFGFIIKMFLNFIYMTNV